MGSSAGSLQRTGPRSQAALKLASLGLESVYGSSHHDGLIAIEGLEAVSVMLGRRGFAGIDLACSTSFLEHRDCGAAAGFGDTPFGFSQQAGSWPRSSSIADRAIRAVAAAGGYQGHRGHRRDWSRSQSTLAIVFVHRSDVSTALGKRLASVSSTFALAR